MQYLNLETVMFYLLATTIVVTALSVLFNSNPLYGALNLAIALISMAVLFYGLEAPFIAGVQLIVYAGAVMVLFVMVLMLFDLRKEKQAFSGSFFGYLFKFISFGFFIGLLATTITLSTDMIQTMPNQPGQTLDFSTKALAKVLYTDYLFAFEVLGVLLLIVAIGVVVVSRIKGGTHADS